MSNFEESYRIKSMSVDEVLGTIRDGDRIFTGLYNTEPKAIMKRMHEIAGRVKDVDLWMTNDMGDYPIISMEGTEGSVNLRSGFIGRNFRKAAAFKHIDYIPNDLHRTIELINSFRPITVYIGTAAPMNEEGYLSLGPSAQLEVDALRSADRVILEVNRNNPFTYGDTLVHIDEVTAVVESDEPNYTMPEIGYSKEDEIIGGYVASLIKDGDCIQLGLGGTPTAIGKALTGKHDLGAHTELFGDTMMELAKQGVLNNSKKNINTGKVSTAFCWGSEELYEFIDHNEDVEIRSSSYINDPFVIAQNDNMVSINAAIGVDLTGQICSETIGTKQYSGSGGAMDFAYGALHSKGGRGIIALHSSAKGGQISKISAMLSPGSAVTIPRSLVDHVVTEYGIARLRGRSLSERAKELIAVAHPNFREELTVQAKEIGLL